MTPAIWTPEPKSVIPPGLRRPIFPGERGWHEAYRLAGLVNGGMVNGGHALVDGGTIRATAASIPPLSPALNFDPALQVYTDTGATTPAVNDGDAVQAWTNQGSISATLVQVSTTDTLKLNIINGKPVVRFAGTGALRKAFTWDQPITIFAVAKPTWEASNPVVFDSGVGAQTFSLIAINPSGTWEIRAQLDSCSFTWTSATWGIVCCIFNGASSQTRLNAGSANTGNAGTQTSGGITIGGSPNGSTGRMTGDVAQIVGYSSALSTTDETTVRNYLNAKFAIF